jgi:hypothetical protein
MKLKEIENLQNGDEVFWTDPDDGIGSRHIIIQSIKINGEVICITGDDGSELECYDHELS